MGAKKQQSRTKSQNSKLKKNLWFHKITIYIQVADSKCLYISNDPIWPFTSSGDAFANRAEEKCAKMGLSLALLTDPESDESVALKEISSKII